MCLGVEGSDYFQTNVLVLTVIAIVLSNQNQVANPDEAWIPDLWTACIQKGVILPWNKDNS